MQKAGQTLEMETQGKVANKSWHSSGSGPPNRHDGVGESVGDIDGVAEGEAVVGFKVGDMVGFTVGGGVGARVGLCDGLGVGNSVGTFVGAVLGDWVGRAVGTLDGEAVGEWDGVVEGDTVQASQCAGHATRNASMVQLPLTAATAAAHVDGSAP